MVTQRLYTYPLNNTILNPTALVTSATNRHAVIELTFRPRYVSCKCTHIVQDVHPSLHGDALENGENSKEDIVKVGDAKVGSNPVLPTGGTVRTGPCRSLQATGELCCLLAYGHKHTFILRH